MNILSLKNNIFRNFFLIYVSNNFYKLKMLKYLQFYVHTQNYDTFLWNLSAKNTIFIYLNAIFFTCPYFFL